MRFLVTGGCGFIGSAVTRALVESGDQVLVLDRRKRSSPVPGLSSVIGKTGLARLEADIGDRAMMRAVVTEFKPEAVIHLAAPQDEAPESLFDVSVAGAFSVLEACRRHVDKLPDEQRDAFRFVHALHATPDGAPILPRDAAANAAAGLISEWSRALDLGRIACTGPDLYGAWQREDAPVPSIVSAALDGRPIALTEGGDVARDWLSVTEFADGLIAAARRGEAHADYQFTACAERRDIDLAEALCAILDVRAPRADGRSYASLIKPGVAAEDAPDPPALLDSALAERELGWRPLGFHESLDRAVRWMLANRQAISPQRPAAH
jgi:dTDP-glucose 4,6-dehydratase